MCLCVCMCVKTKHGVCIGYVLPFIMPLFPLSHNCQQILNCPIVMIMMSKLYAILSDGDNVEAAADLDCKLENSDRLQTSTTTDNCQRQDDASNIDRDVETDNGSEEATSNVHPSIPEPHKQSNSVTEEAVKEDTDQPDAT